MASTTNPIHAGEHRYTQSELIEMYRPMLRIRVSAHRNASLYRDTEIPGFVRLSIEQEGAAVRPRRSASTDANAHRKGDSSQWTPS